MAVIIRGGTYGTGTYGTTPFGSRAFDSPGPTLVSSIPVNGAGAVVVGAPITINITSPVELDPWSLSVTVQGQQAVVGGDFVPGGAFDGTIIFDGPDLQILIPTHPAFLTGAVAVDTQVTDLAGITNTLSFVFMTSFFETVAVSEIVAVTHATAVALNESVPVLEGLAVSLGTAVSLAETVPLTEVVSAGTLIIVSSEDTLSVTLPLEVLVDGVVDFSNYTIAPLLASDDPPGNSAFPVSIREITPLQAFEQSGSAATVNSSFVLTIADGTFLPGNVGDYLFLSSPLNTTPFLQITAILGPTQVQVNKPLIITDPQNGSIPWTLKSSVQGMLVKITKPTNGGIYRFAVRNLRLAHQSNAIFNIRDFFVAVSSKPQVEGVVVQDDGQITVHFSDLMLSDGALTDPREYSITGPTTVQIVSAASSGVSPDGTTEILLTTTGLGPGSYQLTVNATGTPHDAAGNPIDPTFNQTVFLGASPISSRSIYTDKGPIVKPPLVLLSGATATINDAITVTLPTASLTGTMVGLQLVLTGSSTNGGTFLIKAVLSPTKARVIASFHLPDPSNGTISWKVVAPRDGEIADDPTDVVVRINGVPVAAQAVAGLLGQIVMSTPPVHGSEVRVDYNWVCNPVVDFRRMNSKEFRFNNWNRDNGRPNDTSRHKYRFNNTLVKPSSFVPLDMRALLDQPLLRDLKYRAYERAYTPTLNDPNLLLFNSPTNHIAFPPLSRPTDAVFINYQATVLPELEPTNPWVRYGTGSATINIDELIVQDTSTGPFPTGNPIFWTRPIDLTFPHVFAAAWRMTLNAAPLTEGVFTGVAAGYSTDQKAIVVGYIVDAGVKKIGFLKAGSGNDPSTLAAWGGGLDGLGNPTGLPAALDWSTLHSYRISRDRDGNVRVFLDGSVVEILRMTEAELPFLAELNDPFNALEGVFFGSISRPATSTSTWNFMRYAILPLNPFQSSPSVFVSYEGTTPPEVASDPWTPVGFHGTETIISNDFLLLDSTSATDLPTEGLAGLISGDFKGFARIEPLLQIAADVVLDVNVTLRTFTHGITPNAVMAAVDDGELLLQLCFFPDQAAPKVSYGGRSLPEAFSPYVWTRLGGVVPTMLGQYLHVEDATTLDGLVYFIDDNNTPASPNRVAASSNDYILEFRVQVVSHMPDVSGFSGATAQIYDSTKSIGAFLRDVAGTKYVTLHSDGVPVVGGQFAFNWDDGKFHTYRLTKSTLGNLVSLSIDGALVGSVAYSVFTTPPVSPIGVTSFGSSTPASMQAKSITNWAYCNGWRVLPSLKHFVGIWKGFDSTSLTGYHLPLKVQGRGASVAGNGLGDVTVNFVTSGVAIGDKLIVDVGPNKGVYTVASVAATTLTVSTVFPVAPSVVDYRIAAETDWTLPHRYRIVRDPGGGVSLFLDTNPTPLVRLGYNGVDLPSSLVGTPRVIAGGLPSIVWGAFDPTNLSQTSWDFVRYGITRSVSEQGIVPHHQVLNQRNVMQSYEHHTTNIPHPHTDFWSESEGISPQTDPDFLRNTGLTAYTLLNEGTPLVPLTQTYEVRRPTPVHVSASSFNNPEDLLNDQSFLLNTSERFIKLLVPDDVLYNCLQVIERDTGETSLIAPFDDECEPHDMFGTLSFQNTVCLTYEGNVLPENDTAAPTPWARVDDNPAHAFSSAFAGILTYGTDGIGTKTIYRNVTPLPDQISLQTEVKFKIKLLSDASGGLGDTQVRFGWSSPGMTMALAFVTVPSGQRYVLIVDLNNQTVVGGILFDFNDGLFHTYRLVRDVLTASVQVFIDT